MRNAPPPPRCAAFRESGGSQAFTLIELMTVVAIIFILITLLIPLYAQYEARAQRVNCASNLTSLYVAANLYVQEQGHWPQIPGSDFHSPAFAQQWLNALSKFGIHEINWVCPTIQKDLKNPDLGNPANFRVDYIATPFSAESQAPYRFPTQPWFIERGDVHGDGNLVIFGSGQVQSLSQIRKSTSIQTPN